MKPSESVRVDPAIPAPAFSARQGQTYSKQGRWGQAAYFLLRRGRWPAFAAFTEERSHPLLITNLDGKCVLQASGTGPAFYSLADLAPKAVYAVSGTASSGEFSRRLLVL